MEDLLALPGRLRRAAALRFFQLAQCEIRDRALAGAAALRRRRRRHDRLQADVVFPLQVVPQDAAKPVTLSLSIEYAVCEKLCVPADGKAELDLTGKPGEHDGKLAQARRWCRSPPRSARGASRSAPPGARESAHRGRCRVAGGAVELFAEGPTADWALPVPHPSMARRRAAALRVRNRRPAAQYHSGRRELKLTAVAGEQAIEVPYRLDRSN